MFAFRHALTREAVAGRLLGRERRRLHEKALAALQESGSDDWAALAYHAEGANRWDDVVVAARAGAAYYLRTGATYQASAAGRDGPGGDGRRPRVAGAGHSGGVVGRAFPTAPSSGRSSGAAWPTPRATPRPFRTPSGCWPGCGGRRVTWPAIGPWWPRPSRWRSASPGGGAGLGGQPDGGVGHAHRATIGRRSSGPTRRGGWRARGGGHTAAAPEAARRPGERFGRPAGRHQGEQGIGAERPRRSRGRGRGAAPGWP